MVFISNHPNFESHERDTFAWEWTWNQIGADSQQKKEAALLNLEVLLIFNQTDHFAGSSTTNGGEPSLQRMEGWKIRKPNPQEDQECC